MKKLLALAFVLMLTLALIPVRGNADERTYYFNIAREDADTNDCTAIPCRTLLHLAAIFGPLFSGSPQTPPSAFAPVVAANTCNIALPVVSQNVVLVGGGTCQYTATCNGVACGGVNAITSWAITAQSTANAFTVTTAGVLQGGSAASSVTTAAYTVTVTATNTAGTSPGVVQTVNAFAAPVVASHACTIKSPVTNGVNVVLQAGGNCQYTATCSGGACSGGNAISAWAITSQTRTNGYQITNAGILQGGSSAASITNETDTVTITATNAGGTSAAVGQTVTAVTVPAITNQNFSVGLPLTNGQTIGTMVASPTPSSWAITAVSTVTTCPKGMSFPTDGCTGAPGGTAQFPTLLSGGAYSGQNWTTRPPWNVAGVDYAVASIAQITTHCGSLTDWQTLPTSGSISWSGSGHNVNISGTNTVATCYDFSLHGGAQILVSGTNNTVSWSSLAYGANGAASSDQSIVNCTGGSSPSFLNNYVTGNGSTLGLTGQSSLIIASSGCGGTVTMEYNYFLNFQQHVLENNANNTIVYKYNLVYNGGSAGAGPHLNYQQFGNNGGTVTSTVAFNTTYQPTTPLAGGEGFQCYANGTGATACNVSNNTMIYGPNGEGRLNVINNTSGIFAATNRTVNANYIDYRGGVPWSGCGGFGTIVGNSCVETGTGGTVTYTNNIFPPTGATIPAQ